MVSGETSLSVAPFESAFAGLMMSAVARDTCSPAPGAPVPAAKKELVDTKTQKDPMMMVRIRGEERRSGAKLFRFSGDYRSRRVAPTVARGWDSGPILHNRIGQQFGHVFGVNGREVFELMPATCAGSDDDAVGRLGADLLHERGGDFEGEIVFRFQGAEGAGHAAAAGIEERGGAPGQTRGEFRHEAGFHEGFGVAVRVDRDVAGLVVETESVWFVLEKFFNELLEEMTTPRDRFGVGQLQFAVILDEHGVARRFEEQDWRLGVRSAKEIEVMPAHVGGGLEIALTEGGTAAALAAFDE